MGNINSKVSVTYVTCHNLIFPVFLILANKSYHVGESLREWLGATLKTQALWKLLKGEHRLQRKHQSKNPCHTPLVQYWDTTMHHWLGKNATKPPNPLTNESVRL